MKKQAALGQMQSLTTAIVRRLDRALFGKNESPDELTPGQLLFFRFADMLVRMRVLPEDRRDILLEEMCDNIVASGDLIAEKLASKSDVPSCVIAIGNRLWAAISGKIKVLHLPSGKWQSQSPPAPLEMIHYSLTSLALLPFQEKEDEAADISQRFGEAEAPE